MYNCVQCFFASKLVSQMLMHATAHGGCMDTVRETALEADPGGGIPCHLRDWNCREVKRNSHLKTCPRDPEIKKMATF